ncbi:hypothetical protein L2E82_31028 [Cichorium intybus]|uniref:Uncharacterized protein n=1 Tax=Cichorium intybus TaxID=13427 RepID=A0ACB9D242_CICIN|nr:hypothetical protein L2E82_31028 [Cichorium intybus]
MLRCLTIYTSSLLRLLQFTLFSTAFFSVPSIEQKSSQLCSASSRCCVYYTATTPTAASIISSISTISTHTAKPGEGLMQYYLQHIHDAQLQKTGRKALRNRRLWQDAENRTLLANMLIKNSSQKPKILTVEDKLMVLVCNRGSEERTIPISVITERTKLTVEDHEPPERQKAFWALYGDDL